MNGVDDRPDWAKGPEWDGWNWSSPGYAKRMVVDGLELSISFYPGVKGRGVQGTCGHPYVEPSTALAIANLVAEDRGGWAQ